MCSIWFSAKTTEASRIAIEIGNGPKKFSSLFYDFFCSYEIHCLPSFLYATARSAGKQNEMERHRIQATQNRWKIEWFFHISLDRMKDVLVFRYDL